MPKIIQMPQRLPVDADTEVHHSLILPDAFEESESIGKIQRWLELGDIALEDAPKVDIVIRSA